ncbi:hypothetical protein ACFFX0_31740 [Citricoccus parietis]|uniref:Uncharacterized protein n=1 Tax=Citricoccus parietis TaxID=592307 RepID=A0ABV5G9A6_9MICC
MRPPACGVPSRRGTPPALTRIRLSRTSASDYYRLLIVASVRTPWG